MKSHHFHRLSTLLLLSTGLSGWSVGAAAQDTTLLERLEVEAASDDILVQDGYVAESGRIGSKIDTPLIEVPQLISTVTEKQLDDQNPRSLQEAIGYVPGVRVGAYGFDPRFDALFIRGFEATYSGIFRDGLRQFNSPTGLFRQEPYGLEGITVLKGPASALYGASNAGGLVNLMTKRPTQERLREVELQGGTHDRYQANFDLSGPMNEDETLLYRMTGLVRKSGTALPGFPDDRVYLAPALTWQPDADTKLTLLGEYMDSTLGGTAVFYNGPNGVTDLYGGDPTFNDFDQQQARIGYEFEHRLTEVFTLRQNLRYSWLDNNLEYAYWFAPDPANPSSLARGAGRYAENARSLVVDNQLLSEFDTGPLQHRLLVGLDYGRIDYDQYGLRYAPLPPEGETFDIPFVSAQVLNQVGLYASDQVNYDNWHLSIGGRYDWLEGKTTNTAGVIEQTDTQFSWRVGLSYETPFGLVPFANYTTSFTPNVGTLVDGSPANPTVGEQKEIGVKYKLPGMNAVVTAALFDIEQEDAVVFEVIGGINQQVNRDLRSRGFEIEANASLGSGLSMIASYAYVDMEIRNSLAGYTGNTLNSTPQHVFSVWGDYAVQSGPLEGLGVGAGVRYVGESFGNDANTTVNDDRYYVDMALRYDFGARNPKLDGLRLQVNATNLLDERGVTCTADYCYRDEGRSVVASMRYRF
ncbi:TonB-dependent siderophore receptor [uncultured Nitratireductor sp.]|uniref:TonB-dependent siderophore receptor n=1 Tax=uncultured Nitratireductor sp. TaxID=520953 RepID=UPI0025FE14D6|nr:TonB-dependent siderophore receptor [uncultured Nitratireductor sp.]